MKKILSIYLSILCFLLISVGTNAQTFTNKFSVMLNSPSINATIANGSNINEAFVITLDLGNIVAGDTLAYWDPFAPTGQVWIRTNITKNQGDTIQINRTYSGISATPGVVDYCVRAYLFEAGGVKSTFDTTGYRTCNSVTITGFPAGVVNMFKEEVVSVQKLGIAPNPALFSTVAFDFVAQNSSEVHAVVFDVAGRKVLSHSYGKAFKGQKGYTLDVSSLNSGLYFISLNQDGVKATGQLVK